MSIAIHEISMPSSVSEQLWSDAESAVHHLGAEVLALGNHEDVRSVAQAAGQLALPNAIVDPARSFAEEGNEQGFVVIKGIGVPPELARTFPENRSLPTTLAAGTGKLVTVALASMFGPPLCFREEPRGSQAFVNVVAPERAFKSTPGSTASAMRLDWHVDIAGPQRPRIICLYGVRSQPGVVTRVMAPDRLISKLDDSHNAVLRESRFSIPEGFSPHAEPTPLPLIAKTNYGTTLNYGRPYDATDSAARTAFEHMTALLEDASVSSAYEIGQGDMIVIDNFGLHRRDKFVPDYKNPRTLLRVLVGDFRHLLKAPIVSLSDKDSLG